MILVEDRDCGNLTLRALETPQMNTQSLELAAAQEALELLLREDLPEVGLRALMDGCDSPALRILAGLNSSQLDEAPGCFDRALVELCVPRPSRREAVMRLAKESARAITSGALAPMEGAVQIWRLSSSIDHQEDSLLPFVYFASEWDGDPANRHHYESDTVTEARRLLELPALGDRAP